METKKIRIGIMGLQRGYNFIRMFKNGFPDVEVSAVCEVNVDLIKKAGKEFPKLKIYKEFDEFIDSGLDAVFLANYFHEHAKYAIIAMKKGIAVLSETTAAPTLGECVDLVETAEATGTKYMLAANCLYFPAVHAMKAELESGKYGQILYGEAEYIHGEGNPGSVASEIDFNNLHWRRTMPSCYYNMHTLGPLMYVTGSIPKEVSCTAIAAPEFEKEHGNVRDCPSGVVITIMDNGSVFNTTGCARYTPNSKWYRIACTDGTLEVERYDVNENHLCIANNCDNYTRLTHGPVSAGVITQEEYKPHIADASSHGGIDYYICYRFIKYLKGEYEPFFDVYRSAMLSATGILAWYSALSDGKRYEVPDFHKKEDRDKVRSDYRMPIAKKFSDLTLPCRLSDKDQFTGLI